MKQRLVLAAMAAFALSSCSKNEVTEVLNPSDNINSIGLSAAAGVTRGIETTTATVENSNVISLYYAGTAAGGGNDAGELTLNYTTANDTWDQPDLLTAKLWSSLDLTSGASFYAMHKGVVGGAMNAAAYDNAEATFGVYAPESDIALQNDLVYYAGSITAMPAAGYIRGNFHHALSRIEIYSNQGDYTPFVKTVDFKNVYGSGALKLTPAPTCKSIPDMTDVVSYSYFSAASGSALTAIDGAVLTSAVAVEAQNMIIIPQELVDAADDIKTLDGTSDPVVATAAGYPTEAANVMTNSAFAGIGGSYVKVLYRMNDNTTADVAGYKEAITSRSYQSMVANGDLILPTTIGDDSELYILAGFPFADDQEFAVGFDYDVKLGFGANGGYLLYDYYFDADGNPTNIKVDGIDTNDPVINPDAPIGMMVTVKDWESAAGDVVTE